MPEMRGREGYKHARRGSNHDDTRIMLLFSLVLYFSFFGFFSFFFFSSLSFLVQLVRGLLCP